MLTGTHQRLVLVDSFTVSLKRVHQFKFLGIIGYRAQKIGKARYAS